VFLFPFQQQSFQTVFSVIVCSERQLDADSTGVEQRNFVCQFHENIYQQTMKNTAKRQAGRWKIIQELKLKTLSQKFMFYENKI
jgi:hypothetical protein